MSKNLLFEQIMHISAEKGRINGIKDGIKLGAFVIKDLKIKMPSSSKLSIIGLKSNSSVHIGYHFNNKRSVFFKDIWYPEKNMGSYNWNGSFDIFALWLLNNREHKTHPYLPAPKTIPKTILNNAASNKFNLNTFYSNMFVENIYNKLKKDPNYLTKYYQTVSKDNNKTKLKNISGFVSNAHNTITFVYPQYIKPSIPKPVIDNLFKNKYNTNIVELYWMGAITNKIRPWRSEQV